MKQKVNEDDNKQPETDEVPEAPKQASLAECLAMKAKHDKQRLEAEKPGK